MTDLVYLGGTPCTGTEPVCERSGVVVAGTRGPSGGCGETTLCRERFRGSVREQCRMCQGNVGAERGRSGS